LKKRENFSDFHKVFCHAKPYPDRLTEYGANSEKRCSAAPVVLSRMPPAGGDQSFLLMPKTLRSRGLSKDGDLTTTIFMCGTPFDGYSLTVYAAPSDWENGFWKK
jgi:hypothetical protein